MSVILLTGANGMIGSHILLHLLQCGDTVIAGIRKHANTEACKQVFKSQHCNHLFNTIKWQEIDLQNTNAIESVLNTYQVSCVIHASGKVSFNRLDSVELWNSHVIQTRNLINACIDKPIRFIHLSSLAVFQGETVSPIDEHCNWNPSIKTSVYAQCKYEAELEVWRGSAEGLEVLILNPGVVLAPDYKGTGSNSIFLKLKTTTRFYTSGSTAYISAKDLSKIVRVFIYNTVCNERFICIERNITYQSLMHIARMMLKRNETAIAVSKPVLQLVWICSTLFAFILGRKTQFTQSILHALTHKKNYSNDKLKKHLPFALEPIPEVIEQGLKNL